MIGAPNTQGQKCWVGIVQWTPETSVSEEIADIFRNYNILAMPRVETRGSQNKIKYNLSKEIKALCCDEFSIPNDINIGTNID